ncbi:MAG: BON domain-containing protein [Magnetococcales bacterium]|nr:BON domain-containing protein [Magnetococcales bacterium]
MNQSMGMNRGALLLGAAALLALAVSGCSTGGIYGMARDERTVGTMLDDNALATKIKADMLTDKSISSLDISVYVYKGAVFLVGVTTDPKEGKRAEEIAHHNARGKGVDVYFLDKRNESGASMTDDAVITSKIKARMIAEKNFESTRVEVKTLQGEAILLGLVADEEAKRKAISLAQSVSGVKKVISFLVMD